MGRENRAAGGVGGESRSPMPVVVLGQLQVPPPPAALWLLSQVPSLAHVPWIPRPEATLTQVSDAARSCGHLSVPALPS